VHRRPAAGGILSVGAKNLTLFLPLIALLLGGTAHFTIWRAKLDFSNETAVLVQAKFKAVAQIESLLPTPIVVKDNTNQSLLSAGGSSRFHWVSPTTLEIHPPVNFESPILVYNSNTKISVRLKARLSAQIGSIGAGGLSESISPTTIGLNVFLIAKSHGSNPALFLVPAERRIQLPAEYELNSEVLWYVRVREGKIASFFDLGKGVNRYGLDQINSPDVYAPLKGRTSILGAITNQLPPGAGVVYYRAIAVFPPRASLEISEVGIGFGPNAELLSSSTFSLPGLKVTYVKSFTGEIPLSQPAPPAFDIAAFHFGHDNYNGTAAVSVVRKFDPFGISLKSGINLMISGWKLDRKYE
jgi:hypothetical protein